MRSRGAPLNLYFLEHRRGKLDLSRAGRTRSGSRARSGRIRFAGAGTTRARCALAGFQSAT
jgi:hypothetical protein